MAQGPAAAAALAPARARHPRRAAEPGLSQGVREALRPELRGARPGHSGARGGRCGGGGLNGRRHTAAGPLAAGAIALRLLPAAVRPGHESPDRSAARAHRDGARDLLRSREEPVRGNP